MERFRPSALRTVRQSMYIGALISLLAPAILGILYITISYAAYETGLNCQFQPKETIPVKIQWIRTLTALISVAFLYMWFFCRNTLSFSTLPVKGCEKKLLQEFAVHTSVALVIEWLFTEASLAIETRFQNVAVMAVWRKRWKRHFLAAMANMVPIAFLTTEILLEVVHGRLDESEGLPCRMPFT